MKIVIFGLTISSSWGNGHATLWRGLAAASSFSSAMAPYYAAHRDLTELAGDAVHSPFDFCRVLEIRMAV
jgi:hypothetical protein